MNSSFYDREYYEEGLESGKSAYQQYRWVPELTIPLAMTLIDYLQIKKEQTKEQRKRPTNLREMLELAKKQASS